MLVTGASGQLGRCIRDIAPAAEYVFTDLPELNVCDESAVAAALGRSGITAVINCAAFTDVEGAERRCDEAWKLNAEAPGMLARLCAERNIVLIHVSTDYVFDGLSGSPYSESAVPAPKSVYGRTKLAGEKAVEESGADYVIVRTSWLYSEYGRNFVRTMLRLGDKEDAVRVVNDQTGSPTYASDLARFIIRLLNEAPDFRGTVNYSGSGECTWYELARTLLEGRRAGVEPCTTAQYGAAAPRPAYSVLAPALAESLCPGSVRPWREALKRCLARIEETESKTER